MAVILLAAATAWACVSGPAVLLSANSAKAGEALQVKATNLIKPEPVVVRFNALDGPVLADLGVPKSGAVDGSVTVPAGTAPGNYVLVFTQTKPDNSLTQVPTRALVTVTGETGAQPVLGASAGAATDRRIDSLATANRAVSTGTLVLVGLGVAGVALFLAGVAALLTGRRGAAPLAEKARG